jgi:hypothetical protein
MALEELRILFGMDKKNGLMTEEERRFFQSLEEKYKFYHRVFSYSNEKKKLGVVS